MPACNIKSCFRLPDFTLKASKVQMPVIERANRNAPFLRMSFRRPEQRYVAADVFDPAFHISRYQAATAQPQQTVKPSCAAGGFIYFTRERSLFNG